MLTMDQKKRISAPIVERMFKKDYPAQIGNLESGESQPVEQNEEDNSVGLEAAAAKMISCMKSDDAKGFASALKDFMSILEVNEQSEMGE